MAEIISIDTRVIKALQDQLGLLQSNVIEYSIVLEDARDTISRQQEQIDAMGNLNKRQMDTISGLSAERDEALIKANDIKTIPPSKRKST